MRKSDFIRLIWLSVGIAMFFIAGAQPTPSASPDSILKRDFKRLDIFPAISYSPETSLTLGAIGIAYFDLSKGDLSTSISNVEFLGVYTLKQQIAFETKWKIFTRGKMWRTRGDGFFNRYPDRNYGIGNTAGTMVVEVDDEGVRDTLNYLNFNSDRIKITPAVLRKIRPNLYLGLSYDMEYLYNMRAIFMRW